MDENKKNVLETALRKLSSGAITQVLGALLLRHLLLVNLTLYVTNG